MIEAVIGLVVGYIMLATSYAVSAPTVEDWAERSSKVSLPVLCVVGLIRKLGRW